MILYVLRHGIAEEAAPGGDDGARRLTPRGRAKLRAVAAGMRALGIQFDVLLTSPLVRARESAAIVAEVYGDNPVPRELRALAAGVSPGETVRALKPYARSHAVMIVGHEPGLSSIVALLLTGSADGLRVALKKGGLVALDVGGGDATLRFLLTPRHLRRLK